MNRPESASDDACETRRWWRGRAEGHVLESAHLNLARTVDACRIAVQKQADHHLRHVGRLTAAILLLIRLVDGAQIQRRNYVDQKQNVRREWRLVCAVSNLLKLFRAGWVLEMAKNGGERGPFYPKLHRRLAISTNRITACALEFENYPCKPLDQPWQERYARQPPRVIAWGAQ